MNLEDNAKIVCILNALISDVRLFFLTSKKINLSTNVIRTIICVPVLFIYIHNSYYKFKIKVCFLKIVIRK